MWTNHATDLNLSLSMGNRDALEIVARVTYKYHPGTRERWRKSVGTWLLPDADEVDAIEVVSLLADYGGGKTAALPLVPEICEWIVDTLDTDELIQSAADDRAAAEDEAREYRDREHREMGLKRLAADCGD